MTVWRGTAAWAQHMQYMLVGALGAGLVWLLLLQASDVWHNVHHMKTHVFKRLSASRVLQTQPVTWRETQEVHGRWNCPPVDDTELHTWLLQEAQVHDASHISSLLKKEGLVGLQLSAMGQVPKEEAWEWKARSAGNFSGELASLVGWAKRVAASPDAARIRAIEHRLSKRIGVLSRMGDRKRLSAAISGVSWLGSLHAVLAQQQTQAPDVSTLQLQASGSSYALVVWYWLCSRPYASHIAPLARDAYVISLLESSARTVPRPVALADMHTHNPRDTPPEESTGDALRLYIIEHVYGEQPQQAQQQRRLESKLKLQDLPREHREYVLKDLCATAALRHFEAASHPACAQEFVEKTQSLQEGREKARQMAERSQALNESMTAAAALPSSTQEWKHNTTTRFLYFGVNYGRFNNQLVSMLKGISLSRLLQRTAVMPIFFDGNEPGVLWSQLFSTALPLSYGVVMFDEWLQHFRHGRGKLDPGDVVCVSDGLNGGIVPPEVAQVEDLKRGQCAWIQLPRHLLSNEDALLNWFRTDSTVSSARVVFVMFPYYLPVDYEDAMALVTPSKPVQDEVERFLQANSMARVNYTAVHSRNLEGGCHKVFGEARWTRRYTPKERMEKEQLCDMRWSLVSSLRSQYRAEDLPSLSATALVLASDGQSADNDRVLQSHGAVRYSGHYLTDPIPPSTVFYAVLVDWWLLVRSYLFIGNPTSSFSANVCVARRSQKRPGRTHSPEMCNFWRVLEGED